MESLNQLLQQSSGNAWLFIPTAILLGALHGLEPGHSKTMMAAFIVAVRGTVGQAVLLGLAATASHTLIVWAVALGGMKLFGGLDPERTEPYFQLASGVLIAAIAIWMLWRVGREQAEHAHHTHHGGHHHDHALGHGHHHGHHGRCDHSHDDEHDQQGLEIATSGYTDAHEREHAEDIRRRFSSRSVTTGQIVLFGLTGGLIPCPGAITVLLLCLQLHRVALGAALVLCFSIGLAITMVASGVLAAISLRQVSRRWPGFGELARKAPYVSAALILLVGIYVALHGYSTLPR